MVVAVRRRLRQSLLCVLTPLILTACARAGFPIGSESDTIVDPTTTTDGAIGDAAGDGGTARDAELDDDALACNLPVSLRFDNGGACRFDEHLIGGTVACSEGPISSSYPDGQTWIGRCRVGKARVIAHCTTLPVESHHLQANSAAQRIIASCRADQIVVGGGCACADGQAVTGSRRQPSGWHCTCSEAGLHRGTVICAAARCGKRLGLSRHVADHADRQVSVACPGRKRLLNGGCDAPTDLYSSGAAVGESWHCRTATLGGIGAATEASVDCITPDGPANQ